MEIHNCFRVGNVRSRGDGKAPRPDTVVPTNDVVMKNVLLIPIMGFSMMASATDILKMRILAEDGTVIRVLASSGELSGFERLWSMKSVHMPAPVKWSHRVEIANEKGGDFWLYHPEGWAQALSKGPLKLYRLTDPAPFNRFVGIETD